MEAENSRRKFPKMEDLTKEQIRKAILKKRETSAFAQRTVESLLEPCVSEEVFLNSLPFINQCHIEDVVEERAIIRLCGYPICANQLVEKDIPKQHYRISVKNNKVYDITGRKNFCSNMCFKATNFIKAQMLTSPLWFREYETVPEFHLMPPDTKASMGQELDLKIIEKLQHDKLLSTSTDGAIKDTYNGIGNKDKIFTITSSGDNQLTSFSNPKSRRGRDLSTSTCDVFNSNGSVKANELQETTTLETKHSVEPLHKITHKQEVTIPKLKSSPKSKKNQINIIGEVVERSEKIIDPIITSMTSTKDTCKIQQKQMLNKEDTTSSLIIHAEKCMAEWFTLDSMIFIFGKSMVQEMVAEKGNCVKEYLNNMANGFLYSATSYDQYQQLCRKLNMLDMEDHRYDSKITDREMKPLPDYSILTEESKRMELKVRSFLSGELGIHEHSPVQQEQVSDDENLTRLALVDKNGQNALRRKILLTNLNKIPNDMQRSLGLQDLSLASDVRLLVNSFKLKANNIMFKPVQWPLIGMIVIKLLSMRDPRIHKVLQLEDAKRNLQLMLLSYKQDGGYLDRLVWWLTDIDRLLDTSNTQLNLV